MFLLSQVLKYKDKIYLYKRNFSDEDEEEHRQKCIYLKYSREDYPGMVFARSFEIDYDHA